MISNKNKAGGILAMSVGMALSAGFGSILGGFRGPEPVSQRPEFGSPEHLARIEKRAAKLKRRAARAGFAT